MLARGGNLELGAVLKLSEADSEFQWVEGAQGESALWAYGRSTLWKLNSNGQLGESVDLATRLVEPALERFVGVQAVHFDQARGLVFIGTSHGLAVADAADLRTAEALPATKGAGVVRIGTTAGRLWILLERADALPGLGGPLLLEASTGLRARTREECLEMPWFAAPSWQGPQTVRTALQIDDDRVVVAGDGLWEWSPGGWRPVPGADTVLSGFSPWQRGSPSRAPVVLSGLPGEGLWYQEPPNPGYWYVRPRTGYSEPRALVPDPSGQGVWRLESGAAGATEFGILTFETPHGSLAGLDGFSGGLNRLEVEATQLLLPDGTRRWPESRKGGLLLPSGDDWVHADAGLQQRLAWPLPAGQRLRSCLPGGESSVTAWLAILEAPAQPDRVVRLDLADDLQFGEPLRLELEATQLTAPAGQGAVLLPDSEGAIWFARPMEATQERGAGWVATKVNLLVPEPGEERFLGPTPEGEAPLYLWWNTEEPALEKHHLMCTAHGVVRLPSNEPLFESSGPFSLFPPRNDPPGPWQAWFPGDRELRFRALVHSETLYPDVLGADRRLLLTAREQPFAPARPGGAFVFGVDAPVTSLVPWSIGGAVPAGASIAAWRGADTLWPETLLWSPDSGGPANTAVLGSAAPRLGWVTNVPWIGAWICATPVGSARGEVLGPVVFAGCDGRGIALRRLPPGESEYRALWIPALPVRVSFAERSQETNFWSRKEWRNQPLPSTADTLHFRVAPSYSDWWERDFAAVKLSGDNGSAIGFPADGRLSVPLSPGSTVQWSLQPVDPWNGDTTELAALPVTVDPEPAPERPWVWIGGTLLTLLAGLLLALAFLATWRRSLRAWLRGRHWVLAVSGNHWEGRCWRSSANQLRWFLQPASGPKPRLRRGRESEPLQSLLLDPTARRETTPDSPVLLVRLACDATALAATLPPSVSAGPEGPVVIGYLPKRQRIAPRPAPERRLRIAIRVADGALGQELRRRVRHAGFTAHLNGQDVLPSLLEGAHVLLASEARLDWRALAEGQPELDLSKRSLRARLLVVLGSGANPESAVRAAMGQLAALGVQVLWLPKLDGANLANPKPGALLLAWLEAFLPSASGTDTSLGKALARTRATWPNGTPPAGILLYGDPTLQALEVPLFDAFLSHSHKDKAEVTKLQNLLQGRWAAFRRRLRICRDEEDFTLTELHREVPKHISASRRLIVVCSPAAACSPWVKREINVFLQDQAAQGLMLCDLEPGSADLQLRGFYRYIEKRSGLNDLLRAPAAQPEALVSELLDVDRRQVRKPDIGKQPSQ